MRLLLDTHIFYWSVFENYRLPSDFVESLKNLENEIFLSNVSLWEMAVKSGLGKLTLPESFFLEFSPEKHGLNTLAIDPRHLETYRYLPLHHRDPFDRMLIAQAQYEDLTLVTHDPEMKRYKISVMEP